MPTPAPTRRCAILAAGLAALLLSGCSMAAGPEPFAALGAFAERAQSVRQEPFALDLYRPGDHVAQFTASWCVGASMQMMINLIEDGRADRSRATQQGLYKLARKVSPWKETRPGASVYGWAEGLERLGYGGYEELAGDSRQEVLRLAARQMRLTDRPAGLLVWAGAHAWVLSGFRATADPALTDDFTVTHVWIEDPWAGRVSRAWGPGLAPHALLPVERLTAFVRYRSVFRPQYGRKGRFVVVAPVDPAPAADPGTAPV
jgi:hypothetical protein